MQLLLPEKRSEGSVSGVTPVRLDVWLVLRTVSRSRARRYGVSGHIVSHCVLESRPRCSRRLTLTDGSLLAQLLNHGAATGMHSNIVAPGLQLLCAVSERTLVRAEVGIALLNLLHHFSLALARMGCSQHGRAEDGGNDGSLHLDKKATVLIRGRKGYQGLRR